MPAANKMIRDVMGRVQEAGDVFFVVVESVLVVVEDDSKLHDILILSERSSQPNT